MVRIFTNYEENVIIGVVANLATVILGGFHGVAVRNDTLLTQISQI